MLIVYSLPSELKDEFASSENGKERSAWFLHTLIAIIIPFSSSRTSNLLRVLRTLFGYVEIGKKRYYTFMASPKQRWLQRSIGQGFPLLCPVPRKSMINTLVTALMRMAA